MNATNIVISCKPSLRRAYLYAALYAVLVAAGRYATGLDPAYNRLWWLALAILVAALAYAFLRRWTTTYHVTDVGVTAISGIIARRVSSIAFERITNASARQTVLERVLGLSSLFFDSAGSPLPEVVFLRITNRDAQYIVEHLQQVARQGKANAQAAGERAVG